MPVRFCLIETRSNYSATHVNQETDIYLVDNESVNIWLLKKLNVYRKLIKGKLSCIRVFCKWELNVSVVLRIL